MQSSSDELDVNQNGGVNQQPLKTPVLSIAEAGLTEPQNNKINAIKSIFSIPAVPVS